VGTGEGRIHVREVGTGRVAVEMEGHRSGVLGVSWAPDGSRIVSIAGDKTLRVWEPTAGESLLTLPFPEDPWDLAWSPDGRRLYVPVLDGTVRVLNGGPPT
jgi:WD40 repeat protein